MHTTGTALRELSKNGSDENYAIAIQTHPGLEGGELEKDFM